MVEGFAVEADRSPYDYTDWELQMNRVLKLVAQDKVIIAQSYATGDQERMFALGSYLLVKGDHAFLTVELGPEVEWYPEYDIPIGAAAQSAGIDITELYVASSRVYRRAFDNGFVLVNAQTAGARTVTVDLVGTYYLAQTSGGGLVPESGVPTGRITYEAVNRVNLGPYSAAVLLNAVPQETTTLASSTTPITTTITSLASSSELSSTASFRTTTAPSSQSQSTTHTAQEEPIPGFQIEAILLGIVAGLFVLSYRRSRTIRAVKPTREWRSDCVAIMRAA